MNNWEPMDPYEPDRRFLKTVVWVAAWLALINLVVIAAKTIFK
jgi:hypothetical protein